MLYVFSTCRNFIRTFPSLVYDERHVEDVNTEGEDHSYDSLRYMLMLAPISPKPRPIEAVPQFDPLNLYADKRHYDRYDWFSQY
jgi:hypothetical protein